MAADSSYRAVYLGLGALFLAIAVAAAVLSTAGGSDPIPDPIEQLAPAPGSAVVRQTGVVVDMPVGYVVEFTIDGLAIPPNEIRFTESTGRYTWAPDDGLTIQRWEPGTHTVRIRWDRAVGLPDQGHFSWSFRVQ